MRTIYEIPNTKAKVLLDAPQAATDKVILFLPGISGGAFSDRFQPLVDAAFAENFASARFSSWEGESEVGEKTIDEIFVEVDAAIDFLHQQGYTNIAGVGKSFGGGMLLAHAGADVYAKVLWAPAIGAAEESGTFENFRSKPLKNIDSLLDIMLGKNSLNKYKGRVCFIHGTADQVIPLENSQKLQSLIPGAELVAIEGADHSYKNKEHETEVIVHTIQFIAEKIG